MSFCDVTIVSPELAEVQHGVRRARWKEQTVRLLVTVQGSRCPVRLHGHRLTIHARREHARFTFSEGHWWVTNQGRNGLTVNGAPVVGEQQLSDGDAIRWGTRPDALLSRVEIS